MQGHMRILILPKQGLISGIDIHPQICYNFTWKALETNGTRILLCRRTRNHISLLLKNNGRRNAEYTFKKFILPKDFA